MSFEPGQKFARFNIIRKLGEGGMGEVYLAEDEKLNRKVALKILLDEYFDNPDRRERFTREAKTAAQITHSNIMSIHDLGQEHEPESDRELTYIVMEYIEGESLSSYLANKSLQLKDLLRIAEKTASGLAAAHRLNIVHRDLKTDNIIINKDDEPKILDFGLAKPIVSAIMGKDESGTQTVSQELTQEGKILGTVSYMSPEQARGEHVDTRSDIFSFGILVYRMFTGHFPFDAPDRVSTIAKILESKHPPMREKNPSLPSELERITDKCLQKDPKDRYQDTRDLVIDLRTLRKQFESGVSDTESFIGPAPKSAPRYKFGWVPIVAVLVIAALIVAYFATRNGGEKAIAESNIPQLRQNALAILGFENKTNDPELDWLTAGLPEILLTDLAQSGNSNLISRNRVLSCLEEPIDALGGIPDHQVCVQAAQQLGASRAISGSFYKMGDKIRIDARVEDISTGKILAGEKVIGEDPFILVDSLTQKIAIALDMQDMLASNTDVSSYTSSSPKAYEEYIRGLEKFDQGQYDESLENFRKAIEIDSTFALAYMRIGMVHAFQQRMQEASRYFGMANRFKEKLPVKDKSLLDIYTDLWMDIDIDDAYVKIQSYVANYPDDWEGRFFYAVFLYQINREYDAALAQIDTLLMLDPRDRWGLELASNVYEARDNYAEAEKYLLRSKKYHPKSMSAYLGLTSLYRTQKKYEKALQTLNELLAFDPDNSNAIMMSARIAILKRDFDQARNYTEKLKQYHSEDPYMMYNYAELMSDLSVWKGNFDEAFDYRHQQVEIAFDTDDSNYIQSAYSSLVMMFNLLNQDDSTLYYAEKSYEYATVFNSFNYAFSLLMIDLAYAPRAKQVFDETFQEFKSRLPENMWPFGESFKKVFYAMTEVDTAKMIEGYRELLDYPNPSEVYNSRELAKLLAKQGQYTEAAELLEKIVSGKLEATDPRIYLTSLYYLGVCKQGMGNTEEARADFEEFLSHWGNADVEIDIVAEAKERLASMKT